jgi:hypothetical protein
VAKSDGADTTLTASPAGNAAFTDIAVFLNITAGPDVYPVGLFARNYFRYDGEIRGEM